MGLICSWLLVSAGSGQISTVERLFNGYRTEKEESLHMSIRKCIHRTGWYIGDVHGYNRNAMRECLHGLQKL